MSLIIKIINKKIITYFLHGIKKEIQSKESKNKNLKVNGIYHFLIKNDIIC